MEKPHIDHRLSKKHQGFALVVTLSLMILLTIIAVGLLSLSSIALRSTNGSSAMAEARQNARLALMLALGEVQKHAGPDQRITASADIAGDAAGLALPAGAPPMNDRAVDDTTKGLSGVQPGTRYWTGVFANKETVNPLLQGFTKTPSPSIVHWLVSGDTTAPGTLPSAAAYAVSSAGQVADPKKAVVLAGRYTVGEKSGSTDRYVVAPLVNIMGDNPSNPVGRYGWWVGDEGVKAKINIPKSFDEKNNYAALVAQRRGWETVTGFDDPASPYPDPSMALQQSLPKIISLPETALLLPSVGTRTSGASPLQGVFHSATTDSMGLLTDSLSGGMKIDLSAVLAGSLPTTSAVPSVANYPVKGRTIIPAKIDGVDTAASKMKAPTWDALKEFHDLSGKLKAGSLIVNGASITSNLTASITPVITDFRILMGAKLTPKSPSDGTFKVIPCGKIAIGLANPFSYPLKWEKDIEIEIFNQTPPGNQPSRVWGNLTSKNAAYIPQTASEPAVFNQAIFRIPASSLEPGEARAYTVGSYVKRTAGSTSAVTVGLTPFASSGGGSFANCVEMDNTTFYNPDNFGSRQFELDVRETWQTSLIALEMRLADTAAGTRLLQRIEGFELDNSYFQPNQRKFNKTQAAAMTSAFPLMLYSYQISQPGAAYLPYMPTGYTMGQRGSSLRTFADFNIRATRIRKPITSYNPPPYFVESNDSLAQLPGDPPGGLTGTGFTRNMAVSPFRWGHSPFGPERTVLFTVPSSFSSLAQLQHADLTGDDLHASLGHQPGNAVGNSYATPFVTRSAAQQKRRDYILKGNPDRTGTIDTDTTYYDISYLLNLSLWDGYFFSTIPVTGAPVPANPTLVKVDFTAAVADIRTPIGAAPRLLLDGAFNVNSTDKNAWKAFLASAKHFEHAAGPATRADAAFPRSLEQPSPSATPATGNGSDSFSGYRRLTDAQLEALAVEIVKQVRLRGPFVSVSHFINRALADIEKQPALSRSGALQAAIDESGANISFKGIRSAFSNINPKDDAVTLSEKNGAPRADYDGGWTEGRPTSNLNASSPDWAQTSADRNYGSIASIIADRKMLSDTTYIPEQGFRSTGIPGWLTQADVLQVIGSSISARSDTFRIRAFGEVLDASGKSVAKAYCEAVVQRTPSYIDPANDPTERGTQLSTLNKTYGRQYQIVSFRWLSPLEI